MSLHTLPAHSVSVMFSAEEIQARITALGAQITKDYPDQNETLLLVGVLKGAALFLAGVDGRRIPRLRGDEGVDRRSR